MSAAVNEDGFAGIVALLYLGICELLWPNYWRRRDQWCRWKAARDNERSDA